MGIVFFGLLLCFSLRAASPPAIGIITASGHFTVDGSRIWGNSTLFDGARVETWNASSELALRNGVKVHLAVGSAARIWANRLNLERGSGQITAPGAFEIGAGDMTVSAKSARLMIALAAPQRLQVAALSGSVRVSGAGGALLGSVIAGRNMNFALFQAITRAGCLVYKDGGFLLQSDDSPEVLQLTGPDLAANVGNRVEVTGRRATAAPTVQPAAGVMDVTSVAPRTAGGCLTVAAALNAQTSVPQQPATPGAKPAPAGAKPAPAGQGRAPSASKAGLSTGAKVAIVAGIAGGGAAAAIALMGNKSPTSP
jgi:hypothetical protein